MPNYDRAVLVKVAEMYFYQGASQKEIGQLLSISTATVSRLLKEAYAQKIVKVEIVGINISHSDIADAIKKEYGLESVSIVNTPAHCDENLLKKYIGQMAKGVLASVLNPDCTVGVGVGETIWEMIASFKVREIPFNFNVVSLMGGWSNATSMNAESLNILYRMSQTLGCTCKALLAPSVLTNRTLKEELLKEPEIMQVTSLWPKLDVAVFGIGPSINLSSHRSIYGEELEGVTGDICGWPLTNEGDVFKTELTDRLMAISPTQLMDAPVRIGIGGGKAKCANTISALKGGYLTHLVTDYDTAKFVMDNGGTTDKRK